MVMLFNPTITMRTILGVTLLGVAGGCVSNDIDLRVERLEAKVVELQDRIDDMEALESANQENGGKGIPAPCFSAEALQGRISSLLKRRSNLLIKYTENHPSVVELDRRIQLAQDQITTLDQSEAPCGRTSPGK